MAKHALSGNKVRVAFIGAGDQASRVHYPALASFADVELVGTCDLIDERAGAMAEKYHIAKRYRDYRKMVTELKPDAVYAVGQPHEMYDVWAWCLQQGMNLCIEKPMGLSIHQARNLVYLAEKHQCITQVSFQRRIAPMSVRLKEECLKRGPVQFAACEFYKFLPKPQIEARDHMMDDGVHAIDTLRWICGGQVVGIQSISRQIGVPDINFFAVMLSFDNGSTGLLVNNWASGRRIFRVQMHSPGACAEGDLEGKGHIYLDGDTKGVEVEARELAGSDEFRVFGGFAAKNRQFIDAVKSGANPESCFADAIKTMEVAEKVLAQAILG